MEAQLYRSLYRIRRVEEEIARVYPSDCIKSPVHLSIGQEAVSVGVCAALEPQDVVYGTYRGHALYLARGGDLRAMLAELYGKVTGCARGKGGSMHLIDTRQGIMGMSAVVGTTIANAVGHAYAFQLRRQTGIVASFFGDGATEEGVFTESLNFAALKCLPILFVCENNRYAIHTHQSRRQGNLDLCGKARAQGIPATQLDGNDVLAIHAQVEGLVKDIRSGGGPRFIEVLTCRWREHVGPSEDFHLGYRTKAEVDPWQFNDALPRLGRLIDADEKHQIEQEVEEEIAEALAFAESSPFPEAAELLAHTYKE